MSKDNTVMPTVASDTDNAATVSPSVAGSPADLLAEIHELTKALTGLTCGGSEFFNRKGDRYVADIQACVQYVRRRDTDAHERTVRAIRAQQSAEARSAQLLAALQSAIAVADEAQREWDAAPSGMRAGKILIALAGDLPGYRPDTDAIHAALSSAAQTSAFDPGMTNK